MADTVRFGIAAMMSMLIGSQAVHAYYRPLDDLPAYVEREREKRKQEAAKEEEAKKTLDAKVSEAKTKAEAAGS